jgi:hypothetical protein
MPNPATGSGDPPVSHRGAGQHHSAGSFGDEAGLAHLRPKGPRVATSPFPAETPPVGNPAGPLERGLAHKIEASAKGPHVR